jgi:hypothetical protein
MRRLISIKSQWLAQLIPVRLGPPLKDRHFANPRQQAQEHQRQNALQRMPHAPRLPRITNLSKYLN